MLVLHSFPLHVVGHIYIYNTNYLKRKEQALPFCNQLWFTSSYFKYLGSSLNVLTLAFVNPNTLFRCMCNTLRFNKKSM